MPTIKGLEWTFDTVASSYGKLSPGYVAELYQAIYKYIPINENCNVVEIGSGSGQATYPLLKTGCKLTEVEYGTQFSDLLKEKFKNYKNFSVVTGKFEETDFEKETFDLVFSATAFHWIPEKNRIQKNICHVKKRRCICTFCKSSF